MSQAVGLRSDPLGKLPQSPDSQLYLRGRGKDSQRGAWEGEGLWRKGNRREGKGRERTEREL